MPDYREAAQRLLKGARAYRNGPYSQQGDLQDVADAYLQLLDTVVDPKCFLLEEDPPEDHGKPIACTQCWNALCSLHTHAEIALAAARKEAVGWKEAWLRRGEALRRPCGKCGYVQAEIKPMESASRQAMVLDWAVSSFGDIATNRDERAARLVEEAIEIAQTELVPLDVLKRIADRVYSRPAGELAQEIGGLGITLDALAENAGLDAQAETEKELARVLSKPKEWWQQKHAEKVAAGTADLTVPPAADQEHKSLHQSGGLGDRTGG